MKVQVNDHLLCLLDNALSPSDPIHMAGSRDIFNKLTSVFYASVLLLIMNFVITLSK